MLSKEELSELLSTDVNSFNNEVKNVKGGADLTEMDFSGINVEGAEFFNADLTSSTFSDSTLTSVKFEGCDLTSVDFTRANLIECSFNESVLNGTDFSYAKVDYCNFTDADLAGAIVREADLSNSEDYFICELDSTTLRMIDVSESIKNNNEKKAIAEGLIPITLTKELSE